MLLQTTTAAHDGPLAPSTRCRGGVRSWVGRHPNLQSGRGVFNLPLLQMKPASIFLLFFIA